MNEAPVELTTTLRDEEKKRTSKPFLIYEPFSMKSDDPIIQQCLKELLDEFKGTVDDIKIKATMILR